MNNGSVSAGLAYGASAETPTCEEYSTVDRASCQTMQELSDKVLLNLKNRNFCVIDNFLGDPLLHQILEEIYSLYNETNLFHPGQLSQKSVNQEAAIQNNKEIRGDFVAWIDFATHPDKRSLYSGVRCIDEIIALIGSSECLTDCNIRSRSSIMVACYPGHGTHYKRHVDNPSKDGRKLTTILYLNKDYVSSRDGGMLRIYKSDSSAFYDVAPTYGRLVVFWSDSRTPHEVLPSFRERFAISVWYFDTKERIEALQTNDIEIPFNE